MEKLAQRHGTPLYVYSGDEIARRVEMFSGAFPVLRPLICYSVKANPALAILRLIDRQNGGFDIVSGGELERVLTLGKEAAQRVVFSGVGKTAAEMDLALRAGILIFNVESEAEIELLAERAAKRPDSGADRPPGKPGCLRRDPSVYLNGAAGTQVWH